MSRDKDNFIMLPTVDFCFKGLMENPKVRQGFIAALLNKAPEEIKETVLLPTILRREYADDKSGILDVRVLLYDGAQMDMEMQVASFEFWDRRVIFYLSKMFADQMKKGESYDKLQKCIHVSILNFVHVPDDEECYRRIAFVDERTGKIYSDLLEIQILELPKLSKKMKSESEVVKWMRFFSGKSREEFVDMAKTSEYLEEAYRTLEQLSADDIKRMEYEAREKALRDYNSQMSSALARGQKVGEQIGEERTKKIFKLHLKGKAPEEIAEICNLPVERVKQILE